MFNYQNLKSSFWLNQDYLDIDVLTEKVAKDPTADLIRLASYRKAISNFVNLVTGKSIPVTFTVKGDSYTDGKSVVISSGLKEKDFDEMWKVMTEDEYRVRQSKKPIEWWIEEKEITDEELKIL